MLGVTGHGWFGAVLSQPALVTVPLSFGAMVVGSLLTAAWLPAHVGPTMVRLHTPEHIDLDRGSYHPEQRHARRVPFVARNRPFGVHE
jgi:hypothetical protein